MLLIIREAAQRLQESGAERKAKSLFQAAEQQKSIGRLFSNIQTLFKLHKKNLFKEVSFNTVKLFFFV